MCKEILVLWWLKLQYLIYDITVCRGLHYKWFFYTLVPYFCFKLNERTDIKINQKSKNVWKIEFHQLSTFITTTHGSVWWRYEEMVRCVLSSVTPPDLLYILQINIYCVIMLHFFCHQTITPPFCRWQNYCVTCLVELLFGC